MPAHGNSFLHHPSCAQVQRQHQQIDGSCRFYPASRHSHSPHQLRLRTFNLSKDPGDLYLGFLSEMCQMKVALSADRLPRPHCQCVTATSPSSVAATPKPPPAPAGLPPTPLRNRQRHQQSIDVVIGPGGQHQHPRGAGTAGPASSPPVDRKLSCSPECG